jgi:tetrahydromethanopterin S-methyltransferase subunit F
MSAPPSADQRLPAYEDIEYSELPKFIALYLDATKWIVGLATGSFFVLGTVLADKEASGFWVKIAAMLAIVSMTLAAALGVRALQGYTKLANLIERHAARKALEVDIRNNGFEDVRWVTQARLDRIRDIKQWIARSNSAYLGMTSVFTIGIAVLLLYGGLHVFRPRDEESVQFIATSSRGSAVLGIIRDKSSKTDCVIVHSQSGIDCRRVPIGPD